MRTLLQDTEEFYGRKNEVEALKKSLQNVVESKRPELVTVGGVSGAGKSRLVASFCRDFVGSKASVCSGKCDPSRCQEPFSSVADALQSLCVTLIDSEDCEEIVKDVKEVLGDEAPVLMSVIPGLSGLLGENSSPVVTEGDSSVARDRLKNLVRGFVRVVAKARPVVLVSDDVQWIDTSSLRVLSWLMNDPTMNGLLLVVTYRVDEISPEHPFMKEREIIVERKISTSHIEIKNLTLEELNSFIANILRTDTFRTTGLSEVIFEKTHGNIFFTLQFLQALEKRKMLNYLMADAKWEWTDPERIRCDTTIATNVVNLVANKIKDLSPEVQLVVKMASCIASTISVLLLSRVMVGLGLVGAEEVDESLEIAKDEGLFMRLDQSQQKQGNVAAHVRYKFAHDRIQQAAYSLVGSGFVAELLHFRIGQQVLDYLHENGWEEGERERGWVRFIAADQMHRGRSCITKEEDRVLVASLNLSAGKKAMDIAAFSQASQYFNNGIAVLEQIDQPWEHYHDLMIALHQNLADAWWCVGDPTKSEQWVKTVLEHARTTEERLPASVTLAQVLGVQQRHKEAIEVEIKELRALDVFPKSFKSIKGLTWLINMKAKLKATSEADVLVLPECTDERIQIATKLLLLLCKHATYTCDDMLQVLSCVLNLKLILQHGVNKASVSAFAQIGTLVSVVFGDAKEGYRLGQISMALMKRLNFYDNFTVLVIFKFCCAWYMPLTETIEPLLEGYTRGMKQGQVELAFVCLNFYLVHCFLSGLSLGPLLEDAKAHHETMVEFGIDAVVTPLKVIRQSFLNLAGAAKNPTVLTGEALDEERFHSGANSSLAIFHFHVFKAQIAYFYRDYRLADKMRAKTWKHRKASLAYCQVSTLMYFNALIPLALAHQTGSSKYKRRARSAINAMRKAISKEHKGINLIHKLHLLNADYLALNKTKNSKEIRQAFDRAITNANRVGVRQDAALGNLRAGLYCMEKDITWASHYLTRSVNLFKEWGAFGVAKHLEDRFISLVERSSSMPISTDHKGRQRHSEILVSRDVMSLSGSSAVPDGDDFTADTLGETNKLLI